MRIATIFLALSVVVFFATGAAAWVSHPYETPFRLVMFADQSNNNLERWRDMLVNKVAASPNITANNTYSLIMKLNAASVASVNATLRAQLIELSQVRTQGARNVSIFAAVETAGRSRARAWRRSASRTSSPTTAGSARRPARAAWRRA